MIKHSQKPQTQHQHHKYSCTPDRRSATHTQLVGWLQRAREWATAVCETHHPATGAREHRWTRIEAAPVLQCFGHGASPQDRTQSGQRPHRPRLRCHRLPAARGPSATSQDCPWRLYWGRMRLTYQGATGTQRWGQGWVPASQTLQCRRCHATATDRRTQTAPQDTQTGALR